MEPTSSSHAAETEIFQAQKSSFLCQAHERLSRVVDVVLQCQAKFWFFGFQFKVVRIQEVHGAVFDSDQNKN